jgi:hypothetical protein
VYDLRLLPRVMPAPGLLCILFQVHQPANLAAEVVDLTDEGVGLQADEDLPPGRIVTLAIFRAGVPLTRFLPAYVAHSGATNDGRHRLGLWLPQSLSPDECQAALGTGQR